MIIPIDRIGTWKCVLLTAQSIEINYVKLPNFCGKVTTLIKIDWLCFLNKTVLLVNATVKICCDSLTESHRRRNKIPKYLNSQN